MLEQTTGRLRSIILIVAAAILVAGAAMLLLVLYTGNDQHIVENVYIGPWNVSRMTGPRARDFVHAQYERLKNEPVMLQYDGREWVVTAAQAGVTLNVDAAVQEALAVAHEGSPLRRLRERSEARRQGHRLNPAVRIDRNLLMTCISLLQMEVDQLPLNARLTWNPVTIIPHQNGRELDVDRFTALFEAVICRPDNRTVSLPVRETVPDVTSDELAQGDYSTVVAQYATRFDASNAPRVQNLKMAAAALNGILARPGDIVSFNNVVGPRVAEKGYQEAAVLIKNELVPGIGGGVCQVSTTLYNAVLLANLRVVQRTSHSRPVAYVPKGRDATVTYGALDFQFMNDSIYPLYLMVEVGRTTLTVRLLGAPTPDRKVFVDSKVLGEVAFTEMEEVDAALQPGERVLSKPGQPGYRVEVWRRVVQNNVLVKREMMGRVTYKPIATLYKTGPRAGTN